MKTLRPGDGVDTALARLLHDHGTLEHATLRTCLDEIRRRRAGDPEATLAKLLVQRGLVSQEVVDDALTLLAHEATLLDKTLPDVAPAAAEEPAVERLGPYRVVRELARGGMGAVHEVVHEETGGRCALKTLLPSLLGGLAIESLERFKREAEVMGKLDHPHVARIHAAVLEGATPYLVQPLLTGGTLRDRIQAGPLEVGLAVEITLKLARGLQHCHEHGVLHRDLKPHNVMFDERGEPQLVDFGLAQALDVSQRLTETGTVMGTPGYMAPEQARGQKEVDARTDVYGLGALLYAMLTGRAPFGGGNVPRSSTRSRTTRRPRCGGRGRRCPSGWRRRASRPWPSSPPSGTRRWRSSSRRSRAATRPQGGRGELGRGWWGPPCWSA